MKYFLGNSGQKKSIHRKEEEGIFRVLVCIPIPIPSQLDLKFIGKKQVPWSMEEGNRTVAVTVRQCLNSLVCSPVKKLEARHTGTRFQSLPQKAEAGRSPAFRS